MSETENPGNRESRIEVSVQLDGQNIPQLLQWKATDAPPGLHEAAAMMLALWDGKSKNGLSMDLWTKAMTIPEMNLFFYQTLLTMSDTFHRATQNESLSEEIKTFARQFIEKASQQS